MGGPFGSSVLATANVLMAASLASGETVVDFAACEPEVVELTKVLKKMGVGISGEGTPQITIRGRNTLGGFQHRIMGDRIEAGTFMVFALVTSGSVLIKGVSPHHLGAVIDLLKKMGQHVEIQREGIYLASKKKVKPANITTLPFPGFPTDLQAQFMVLLSQAVGISTVTEKVYPDRFMHVPELNRMGANISRFGPVAVIEGKKDLRSAEVMASDLRASASLVAAGLAGSGLTTVHRIYHLYRGYDKFIEKLQALGAEVYKAED